MSNDSKYNVVQVLNENKTQLKQNIKMLELNLEQEKYLVDERAHDLKELEVQMQNCVELLNKVFFSISKFPFPDL